MAENSPLDISTWIRKLVPNFKDFIAPYGLSCIFPVDTVFFLPLICVLNPEKSKNIIFSPYPEWRGATRLDTGAPKVLFSVKMTKIPLINLGLTESQTKSKSPQNITFHSFTSNLSFLDTFGKFDLELTPGEP